MTPALNDSITLDFITYSNTGAAVDADSTPTCSVFEDANDTPILSPTVTKRTSLTGNYRTTIACTAANGFENDKSYNVVVAATVATIATKAVIAAFQIKPSTLNGPSSVTLTFKDSLNVAVPLVRFTIVGQASGQANVSGVAAFGLLDGTYTVAAAPTNGVFFANTTLVVSGTTALTITGTSPSVTPPVDPDLSLVYGDFITLSGDPLVGAKITFKLVTPGPAIDGGILQQDPVAEATTDSDGHFQLNLTKTSAMTPTGCLYLIECAPAKFKQRTTITASTFNIGSLIT